MEMAEEQGAICGRRRRSGRDRSYAAAERRDWKRAGRAGGDVSASSSTSSVNLYERKWQRQPCSIIVLDSVPFNMPLGTVGRQAAGCLCAPTAPR
jgi:hypothetical protein